MSADKTKYGYADSELIIALVGAVGTDLGYVSNILGNALRGYEYQVHTISVSSEIIDPDKTVNTSDEYERISTSMNLGNKMRTEIGPDVIARGAAYIINKERGGSAPLKRRAFIIKSLKHPAEVKILKEIYGNGFYLIGVSSEGDRRREYLIEQKHISEKNADELIHRDESETDKNGQHTRDTFQMADFFVAFDDHFDTTRYSIDRFIKLVFGDPFETPTFAEYAMFCAYCASLRSADLSRQIGAAICKNNEVIATGMNDCPSFGGGLYWREINGQGKYFDLPRGREYTRGQDQNKQEFETIARSIMERFGIENSADNMEKMRETRLGDLTEFGRIVHAEMEALAMCARNNISCRGADAYVTTFPCHNCAKHLIAAGVKAVTYIEPYPKSRTFKFYDDSVSKDKKDADNKVVFLPFFGVGPTRFINMFSMKYGTLRDRKRKDGNGKVLGIDKRETGVRDQMLPTSYLDREVACAEEYLDFLRIFKEAKEARQDAINSAVRA